VITVIAVFYSLGYLRAGNGRDQRWEEFLGHLQKQNAPAFTCPVARSTPLSPALASRRWHGRPWAGRPSRTADVRRATGVLGAGAPCEGSAGERQSRGLAARAGCGPRKLCANRAREMGCRGQLAAKHSPRLSGPVFFVGKFYLFNLLRIMHRLINYCFSAGRTRVYRAI